MKNPAAQLPHVGLIRHADLMALPVDVNVPFLNSVFNLPPAGFRFSDEFLMTEVEHADQRWVLVRFNYVPLHPSAGFSATMKQF